MVYQKFSSISYSSCISSTTNGTEAYLVISGLMMGLCKPFWKTDVTFIDDMKLFNLNKVSLYVILFRVIRSLFDGLA